MTATLRLAIDEKDIFGEPTVEEIGNGLSLNSCWVRKRTGDVTWQPAMHPKELRTVEVERGTIFVLTQIWRPDHQALLVDNTGTRIVVGFRALRKDWRFLPDGVR